MTRSQILIVEDETDIRRFIRIALEKEGMDAFEAKTAEEACIDSACRKPDLIIVDLGLPDGDGKTFIRELRAWSSAPVVVLSARDQETEKVEALDAGADDYLTKPFGVPELLARVRAQLRRTAFHRPNGPPSAVKFFGKIRVNLGSHEVTKSGNAIHLTPIEFRLLTALIGGHGKVLTHRQLLLDVWGPGYIERPHYIRIYMANLRHKLEDEPARPRHFITELQVGYRLAGLEERV
ncbi:two-component system, OmpR family, KDP operon response regulator KdpE [Rhizobiales bacterium GAS191]|nr:two-component system, OmpR family, KDP operon response regulator KdpE [Rhizobiales bacterium GAS191]